jgi:hypothetical protein
MEFEMRASKEINGTTTTIIARKPLVLVLALIYTHTPSAITGGAAGSCFRSRALFL